MSLQNSSMSAPMQQRRGPLDIEAYRRELSELTFNSKPIITSLTIQAQQNPQHANMIVREIERQIRENDHTKKLPILYLIDSICKIVGEGYINIFKRNIAATYLDVYNQADAPTRQRCERLLQTWKNGMPNGSPVFARDITEKLERDIQFITQQPRQDRLPTQPMTGFPMNQNFAGMPSQSARDPRDRRYPTPPAMDTSGRSVSPYPHTSTSFDQPPPPDDSVAQILGKIQAILPKLSPNEALVVQQSMSQILANAGAGNPAPGTTPPPSSAVRLSHPPISMAGVQQPYLASQPPAQQAQPSQSSAVPVDTAELLKKLSSSGYLNLPQASTLVQSDAVEIHLDTKDLQIPRPGAVEVMYSQLPLQCKQCGFRYPESKDGQEKMDAHLDWHFRRNRRLKDSEKRRISRSSFVTEEAWIDGIDSDNINQVNADGSQQNPTDNTAEAADSLESAADHSVTMPSEGKHSCPICGEEFKQFWSDEEEEWKFQNAIAVSDTIYHYTCHSEAVRNGNLVTGSLNSDPLELDEGRKRKADDDDLLIDAKVPRTETAAQ